MKIRVLFLVSLAAICSSLLLAQPIPKRICDLPILSSFTPSTTYLEISNNCAGSYAASLSSLMAGGSAGTATSLAANGTNCTLPQFPLGIDASGNAESCTSLPTTITGTANQITASAATGPITLSITSSPTLPGTTTGTFSGNLTGNVTGNITGNLTGAVTGNSSTTTALASTPTQCSGVSTPFAQGITTAGNANCAAISSAMLPTTLKGWTYTSPSISLVTSTDKVGIGTATIPTEPLSISLNTAQPLASSLSGTTMQSFTPVDAGQAREMFRGIGGSTPSIDGVCNGGTLASPSACTSGSGIIQISASGRDNSAFTSAVNGLFKLSAAETWSTTGHGTLADLFITAIGTTAAVNAFRVSDSGHVGAPAAVAAPTVACTGTGTSPAAPTMVPGSTDWSFEVIVNTGTAPTGTFVCTVTYGKAYGTYAFPVCMLADGASAWLKDSVIRRSTASLSAPVFTMVNEDLGVLTNPTASSSYRFTCTVNGV